MFSACGWLFVDLVTLVVNFYGFVVSCCGVVVGGFVAVCGFGCVW